MATMRIAAIGGCRTPQPEHRSLVRADEQKDDVPARITVAEFQTHDLYVELRRRLGARNWHVRLVEMHVSLRALRESKLPAAAPYRRRGQFNAVACGVTEIDGTSALIPNNLALDRDASATQLLAPRREIVG